MTIKTGTNWRDEPTIKNVEDFRDHLGDADTLMPGGETMEYEVEDPHLNDDLVPAERYEDEIETDKDSMVEV